MVHLCVLGPTPVWPFQRKDWCLFFFCFSPPIFSLRQLKCLLESVPGTRKSPRRCRHHTWSSMSPSRTELNPLSDHRQHPVCWRRLTLRLIILYPSLFFPALLHNNERKINKQKGKLISLPTYRVRWVSLSERSISRHGRWIALFRANHQEAPCLSNSPFSVPLWGSIVEPLTQLDILLSTGCTVSFPQFFHLSLLFIFRSFYISIELITLNSVSRNN